MAEIGVMPHVIEAVLNHTGGHKAGVAGIYNRASYEKEKRTALGMWADHVLTAVEDRPEKSCCCGRSRPAHAPCLLPLRTQSDITRLSSGACPRP
jgi:hypothetical protein